MDSGLGKWDFTQGSKICTESEIIQEARKATPMGRQHLTIALSAPQESGGWQCPPHPDSTFHTIRHSSPDFRVEASAPAPTEGSELPKLIVARVQLWEESHGRKPLGLKLD